MAVIGFHAAHEQIAPQRLLNDLQLAEEAGFQAAMCSDHFNPWSSRQGHSGFAWAWLGAALATTRFTIGTVTAPGQRYHPAIIAQATATLGVMFPGRFWLALGSGENLNESITGQAWPSKELRQRRLLECVNIIRRLLNGEEVTGHGLVTIEQASLWDQPEVKPRMIAPAISVETAARSAEWADGLITVNQPHEKLARMLDAYREAGGRGRAILQVHLCWAQTPDETRAIALDQWANNVYQPPVTLDLPAVEHFDSLGQHASFDDIQRSAHVSSDLSRHAEWLHEYIELGFEELYLHQIGQNQQPFIDAFAKTVLPQLVE